MIDEKQMRRNRRKNRKFQRGGYANPLQGPSHAQGGIPVRVRSTGEMIEVEGGEWIVPERTVKMLGTEFMQNLNDIGVPGRSTSIRPNSLGHGSRYRRGGPIRKRRPRRYAAGGPAGPPAQSGNQTSGPSYGSVGGSGGSSGANVASTNRGANTNIRYVKATDKINRANFLKEVNTASPNPLDQKKKSADVEKSVGKVIRTQTPDGTIVSKATTYTPAYLTEEPKTFYDCVHPDCWKVCNSTIDCKDPNLNMSCEGGRCVEVKF